MKKSLLIPGMLLSGIFFIISCQNGSIDHIGGAKLVILQKIPVVENKFDENFKATLELLYPFHCHDTAFIQEQIFLERIDLTVPYKREFVIGRSLLRDFFGSNNPDKKQSLREDLFYISDTCFEKNPDKQFTIETQIPGLDQFQAIGDYLSRNRKNALVYLISSDTIRKTCEISGVTREVYNDFAKLNCKIVADLRKKAKEELINTFVILIVIPPENTDTTAQTPKQETSSLVKKHNTSASGKIDSKSPAPFKTSLKTEPVALKGFHRGIGLQCPPDSMVNKTNKQYTLVIKEFRNLLHYIATTNRDDTLKRKFKEDAGMEIHKIPNVIIEGISDSDLDRFLNSGFSKRVTVAPIMNNCKVIVGIRIGEL